MVAMAAQMAVRAVGRIVLPNASPISRTLSAPAKRGPKCIKTTSPSPETTLRFFVDRATPSRRTAHYDGGSLSVCSR